MKITNKFPHFETKNELRKLPKIYIFFYPTKPRCLINLGQYPRDFRLSCLFVLSYLYLYLSFFIYFRFEVILLLFLFYYFFVIFFFHVPGCSGMFRVPGYIDALI